MKRVEKFHYLIFLIVYFVPACAQIPWGPESRRSQEITTKPGDVSLGMETDEVMAAWGEPRKVQVAGDRQSGNERWIYTDGGSYLGPETQRIIYFENGRVSGWETNRSR